MSNSELILSPATEHIYLLSKWLAVITAPRVDYDRWKLRSSGINAKSYRWNDPNGWILLCLARHAMNGGDPPMATTRPFLQTQLHNGAVYNKQGAFQHGDSLNIGSPPPIRLAPNARIRPSSDCHARRLDGSLTHSGTTDGHISTGGGP